MSASKYNDLDAVEALIEKAADANASDLHLVAGKAPAIRRFGELVYLDGEPVLTDIDCKALLAVFGINGGTALSNMFVSEGRLDFSQAFGLSKGRTQRVRVNVSLQLRTPSWCFRFI